ncbi:hypothetical protein F4819DRAFT_444796 [Hypoxylon fuscum]|nr:hypothetical protein F4819DRAFT_444796 [Hypoxylon fuscum]
MAETVPRGYRSATEYRFCEEHTDAIVQATAYHRKDYGRSVIWVSPREHINISPWIATPFPRTSDAGLKLSLFDRLPLELLIDVLMHLDMYSLMKLRQTCLRLREVVDSLKPYQMVVSHGLNLLCALLRTRLATRVSLSDFYHTLCTKACTLCGEFSGFVFLFTWNRYCFKCLQEAPETQVQTLADVRNEFDLTEAELDQLRPLSFETLPGIYSMDESTHKSRIAVVSVPQVRFVSGRQPHVPDQEPTANTERKRRNKEFTFMASCALPYHDKQTGEVEHGMSCAGCQLALDRYILGFRGEYYTLQARNKVYAKDGFLEHFRWCKQAQLLWMSSDEGRSPALPDVCRRGGEFKERE